jgi:putative two-component system response regulator
MPQGPPAGQRVLVVDDNPFIRSLLQHGLAQEGYRVAAAEDGLEALEEVRREPPGLILLDIDLPRLPGDEVCRRLKSDPATQLIPIVMVTAQAALDTKLAAWEHGADDYLTKPFHLVEVLARCRSLLRIRRLIEERDSAEAVVFALARAVEAKSPFTHGHSERVTDLAVALAGAVHIEACQRELLRKGGLLHDIGKISIPDAILDKPGALTPEEYDLIKTHPAQGAHIVEPLVSVRDAVPLIRWHHERIDGRGYPDGLRGDDIPLLVRILSVCDVYDSLASDRPYRRAMPPERCRKVLCEEAAGGGLDPDLVAIFLELLPMLAPPAANRTNGTRGAAAAPVLLSKDGA